MSASTLEQEIHALDQPKQRELLFSLTQNLDTDVIQELGNMIETRRRAEEMKTGLVEGVSHDETFEKARAALG